MPHILSRYTSTLTTLDYKYLAAYIVGFSIATICYNYTLQGGDLKFVKDRLIPFLVALLTCCLITLSLTVYTLFHSSSVKALIRILGPLIGWLIFLNTAFSDMNTTL